jgi:hypothetical protein
MNKVLGLILSAVVMERISGSIPSHQKNSIRFLTAKSINRKFPGVLILTPFFDVHSSIGIIVSLSRPSDEGVGRYLTYVLFSFFCCQCIKCGKYLLKIQLSHYR